MRPIKTFNIGSQVFFKDFPDYFSHDIDELCIMDRFPIKGTNVLNMKKDEKDVFFFRDMKKEEFIEDALKSLVPMRAGKFLIPDFAEYLGMTIEDLRKLDSLFSEMDEKHEYEKIIYESYIENNGFYLTSEQKNKAYKVYKEKR